MPTTMLRLSGWLLAGLAFAAPVRAAYDQPGPEEGPPPITARLSATEGDVQVWRVDESNNGGWDEAQINDVVSVSTGLFTGAQSRVEVRWGPHALRLGPQSRGGFSRIGYDESVFNLEYGALNVRLREDGSDRFAVTMDGLRVNLQSPGVYRIDHPQGQDSRLTVFSGHATLQTAASTLSIAAGQALDVSQGGANFSYANAQVTALDDWARRRDEAFREVRSARYVSPYMTGYEDLDANGDWITDPAYGPVWYPRVVVAGWVPYRYGRWRWIAPWGWTWVDDAPWGFAPFHYGRWVAVGGRWCWWPGQRVVRPVYAPALVAWVGGAGWGASVSAGGPAYVGWYPLAPWHPYEPAYTVNVAYRAQINQVVMHAPPAGVSINININTGRTVVPGQGFRQPIREVFPRGNPPPMPTRDLRPVNAPPPRTGFMPAPRDERGPAARPSGPAAQPRMEDPFNKRVATPREQRAVSVEPVHPAPQVAPQPVQQTAPKLVPGTPAAEPRPQRTIPPYERGPAAQPNAGAPAARTEPPSREASRERHQAQKQGERAEKQAERAEKQAERGARPHGEER